jgi:hypothetical protein
MGAVHGSPGKVGEVSAALENFPTPGVERTGPGDREHAVAETALPPDATNGSVAGPRLKTTANCLTGHGDMRIFSRIPGDSIDPARRT